VDDLVFRALADPTRRELLDALFERDGQTLTELEQRLPMTRFGVMKHLRVLEEAALVITRRDGREKLHFLDPAPIRLLYDRWVSKYADPGAVPLRGPMSPLQEAVFHGAPNALRILLVCGSSRAGSTNMAVLRTAAFVAGAGVDATVYEGIGALPLFGPDADGEGAVVPGPVAAMRAAVAAADALLVCTPEYAGALPAALKNLLEWTIGDAGTYGKPIAWINAAGPAAPTAAAGAHAELRAVLGYAGADIVETAIARVPITRDVVGESGLIDDDAARAAVAASLTALVAHVRAATPT
jgi:NAD(P)H-dependent FMN reductase/DNA-binding transcriptional ArsR family regulator